MGRERLIGKSRNRQKEDGDKTREMAVTLHRGTDTYAEPGRKAHTDMYKHTPRQRYMQRESEGLRATYAPRFHLYSATICV